ncbi:MAG: histidine kinase [Bacteroidales bacterium]|nr:histidine kinase [Bacteroidales bacterium]
MNKNNDEKRKPKSRIILWILFILILPPIIGYFFKGPKIISSVSYYFTQTSIGYAYAIAFGLGNSLIGQLIGKLDWTKNPKRTNLISFLLFMGYGITMSVMIPWVIDVYLWGMTGKDVFYDVTTKAFMTIVANLIIFYFYYSSYITNNWIKSVEKNEELKRENLLAKYEALKNQVNPHFLFNSLNTLSGVVEQKSEQAPDFIKKLSDIYRYVLEQSDKELVSIHDEMKFVDDYIFLSKMRFGEALQFHSNLPANNTVQIVPLGLQMLVENAIKHNVIANDKPLKIDIDIAEHKIIVKNNIQKKNTIIAKDEPIGLENLRKRYEYLSNSALEVIESEKEFIVKLPIIQQ